MLTGSEVSAKDVANDGERIASYVLGEVRKRARRKTFQRPRKEPFLYAGEHPDVRAFSTRVIFGVSDDEARAIVEIANKHRPAVLLRQKATEVEILALQSRGQRCISIVDEGTDTQPHADPLAFTLHDLSHLEKFCDPVHHLEQVGFFDAYHRAYCSDPFRLFVARYDETFQKDLGAVACDMNGSSVFLFAALKMKLKMAVRRQIERISGEKVPEGPLSEKEWTRYEEAENEWLEILELRGEIGEAARAVSAKRDRPDLAVKLRDHFHARGEEVLRWITSSSDANLANVSQSVR